MVVKSVFSDREIDWGTLQTRFPAIALELCYGCYEKLSCFYDEKGFVNAKGSRGFVYSEDVDQEMKLWKNSLSLEDIEVLYVYGAGFGHFYKELSGWLHGKLCRKILFFEDDPAMLDALFKQDIGTAILRDPQVHFYYVPEEKMWPHVLEECVQEWMSDRIEWTTLRSYFLGRERKVRSLALKLFRRSAAVHAKVGESLHYHFLMQNIATNLLHIPHSFHANHLKGKFKNVPAVICGAGSSLTQELDLLKKMEHKALIIAGGSAITALSHHGIKPHIAMAVDPNEEEYIRLKTASCFETPFIYSSRLHQEVLSSTHMQMGYLCSNTGGFFEAWVHEKLGIHSRSFALDLGDEALSVTTLATAFAVEMGCNPIIFCGVDLAYSNKQRYCSGVVPSSSISLQDLEKVTRSRDRMVRRKNIEGQFVYTLIKWVMEASCLGEYAQKQAHTTFINLSSKGLRIPNASNLSGQELMESHLIHDYDLRGKLRAESEMIEFSKESGSALKEALKELRISFETCIPLFEQMVQEIQEKKKKIEDHTVSLDSGKMSLIEMDLSEQPAYEVCFQAIFSVYQGILDWWSPSMNFENLYEERLRFLEKKEEIWKKGSSVAQECLAFLKNY